MLQVVARARFRISDRVAMTPQLRHPNCVRDGVSWVSTGIVLCRHTRYLDHSRRDAKSAVPITLWTAVGDSLRGTFLGGVGDAAAYFASYSFVVEAEGEADFDSDADGIGGLGCELATCMDGQYWRTNKLVRVK